MVVAGIEPATSSLWTEALNTRLLLLRASDQTVEDHTAWSPCRALWNQWFFFWAKIGPKSPQFEDFFSEVAIFKQYDPAEGRQNIAGF
jgi:hypothetical protein